MGFIYQTGRVFPDFPETEFNYPTNCVNIYLVFLFIVPFEFNIRRLV